MNGNLAEATSKDREVALEMAIQHFGLANHNQQAIPAGIDKVLAAAEVFAAYIVSGETPAPRSQR